MVCFSPSEKRLAIRPNVSCVEPTAETNMCCPCLCQDGESHGRVFCHRGTSCSTYVGLADCFPVTEGFTDPTGRIGATEQTTRHVCHPRSTLNWMRESICFRDQRFLRGKPAKLGVRSTAVVCRVHSNRQRALRAISDQAHFSRKGVRVPGHVQWCVACVVFCVTVSCRDAQAQPLWEVSRWCAVLCVIHAQLFESTKFQGKSVSLTWKWKRAVKRAQACAVRSAGRAQRRLLGRLLPPWQRCHPRRKYSHAEGCRHFRKTTVPCLTPR